MIPQVILPKLYVKDKLISVQTFYKHLVKADPILTLNIESHEFSDCINELGKAIEEKLLAGYEVILPYNLGWLKILTVSQSTEVLENGVSRRAKVDQFRTKQLWDKFPEKRNVEYIYFINDTGTYNKHKWVKHLSTVYNINYYKYLPARRCKKALGAVSKEGKIYDFATNVTNLLKMVKDGI
jgi:hypothetical protein